MSPSGTGLLDLWIRFQIIYLLEKNKHINKYSFFSTIIIGSEQLSLKYMNGVMHLREEKKKHYLKSKIPIRQR